MLSLQDVLCAHASLENSIGSVSLLRFTVILSRENALRSSAERNLFAFLSQLIWPWNWFFLLSTLTSYLFLITHFWETAPETAISGFIHKGQRRQLHPAHMKWGKNLSWALASHCNCALFLPALLRPFLLSWQCLWGVRTRPSISLIHFSSPPSFVSRRALITQ